MTQYYKGYMHVLTLLMYWALSFAIIDSYMIYSVGFCSKQASVTRFYSYMANIGGH